MVQWRSSTLSGVPKSESNWQVLPVVSLGDCAVDRITWGPGEGLIHARTERSSVMLSEAQLNTAVQAANGSGLQSVGLRRPKSDMICLPRTHLTPIFG